LKDRIKMPHEANLIKTIRDCIYESAY